MIERIQTEGDVGKRNAQVKLPSITLLELTFFRVYSSRLSGIDFSPFGGYQSLKPLQVGS
ncbi:hypothetical protein [Xanthobacter autotrophicus]|uniref:hypothetical protein n=1 Tax=Xanthobacter autotrophicus TaxID=280 RepID=UPI0024A62A7B|nr:hypothetical protein [Xanthobacter autotrophicus]MDI4656450.1 hypothetical protein [Xanthobacter autotrophicus]